MNLSARQFESILNKETPGFFLAQFEGGKPGRFTFLFDPQAHVSVNNFRINGGETVLIFAYDSSIYYNYVWMAFYAQADYAKGIAPYSDAFYLVDSPLNTLTLDLLEPQKILGLHAKLYLVSRFDGLRVLPMSVGEGLGNYDDARRKKQMHVLGARLADGTPLSFFQEPWESGFTIAFPGQIPKESLDTRARSMGIS